MSIEIFRALTPYITLALVIGVGATGWFVRRLITDTAAHFADLKEDMGRRLDKVEEDIQALETARLADQKYLHEKFVTSQVFYMSVGETKALVSKIFDELKEVNRLVNQTLGSMQSKIRAP